MGNDSSAKQSKNRKPQEKAANKLHFLLDTIETEITDLAEVVESREPILDEPAFSEETSAVGLDNDMILTDDLDLGSDLFAESDATPTEIEPVDEGALAALEAMSDAEGEVQAMLAQETVAPPEDATAKTTTKDKEDDDISQALKELLTTREVDVSKLLEKPPTPKKVASKPATLQAELAEDLFDDLDLSPESGKDHEVVAEPPAPEGEPTENLLTELELENTVGEENVTAAEASTSPASDEALAALLSTKIEALVIRLVEEQLSAIAERVIREKINKIFASMK